MSLAHSILKLLLVLALGGGALATAAAAPSHRYLLVVETSRAMQPRKDGTLKAVQDLLGASVGEELRPGDTLGLWTFNDALYAGRFPLRTWSPEARADAVESLLGFVRTQPFEKNAGFDAVSSALNRLVESSDWLTVVLVCSGEARISGTPFDPAINEFCRAWREQQQTVRMPFVVILRAAKGRMISYTLNCAQWTVELPPQPPEPAPASAPVVQAAPLPPQPTTSPPAPVMAAPLILSGRKSEPEKAAPAPASEPTATSPAPAAAGASPQASSPAPASTVPDRPAPVDSMTRSIASGPAPSAPSAATPEVQEPPAAASQTVSAAPAVAPTPASNPPMATVPSAVRGPAAKSVLWILGGGLIAGGAVLLVLRRRRARAHSTSFITRSMEKGQE